jgi:hypothetical protein
MTKQQISATDVENAERVLGDLQAKRQASVERGVELAERRPLTPRPMPT